MLRAVCAAEVQRAATTGVEDWAKAWAIGQRPVGSLAFPALRYCASGGTRGDPRLGIDVASRRTFGAASGISLDSFGIRLSCSERGQGWPTSEVWRGFALAWLAAFAELVDRPLSAASDRQALMKGMVSTALLLLAYATPWGR